MNSHADEDLDHLQKLIDVSTKHLHELELTAAKFGEDGPAHIKMCSAVGQGSTFSFTLPVAQPQSADEVAA